MAGKSSYTHILLKSHQSKILHSLIFSVLLKMEMVKLFKTLDVVFIAEKKIVEVKRMHSSGMCTARTLPYGGLYQRPPIQSPPWTETPQIETPWTETPWTDKKTQRPSWTEIPQTENPLDRDPPWTEIPLWTDKHL